jgi:tetratricopeptide (TPR) repeat protein
MAPELFSFNKRSLILLFCLIFPGAFLPVAVKAQMGGIDPDPGSQGTGGRNTIEGRIYYPSGQNVDKRFKIHLSSISGVDFFTMSDDTGAFSFRRIKGGTYTVIVEGDKTYEHVTEQVDIIDSFSARSAPLGRTYNLQIRLRYKTTVNERASVIDAALMAAPKPAAELYQKALQAEQAGDNEKAIDQLQRALVLYPRFPLALNKLGAIYLRVGKLDDSQKAFSAAVQMEPEVFEPRLNYGIVLLRNKRYKEADPQFQQAIKIRDMPLAHLFRGKTLIHLGKFADAENELQLVIKSGGGEVAMAYRFLGALYNEKGEPKLAIAALEKYLSLTPKATDAESVRQIIKQLRTQSGS